MLNRGGNLVQKYPPLSRYFSDIQDLKVKVEEDPDRCQSPSDLDF